MKVGLIDVDGHRFPNLALMHISMNADRVIKGGTGYAIHTTNGKEIFDKEKDFDLPPEVEKTFPDYSIYPQYSFAVSMTSRGCPRGCAFCHVAAKEGRCSTKVANVSDFWCGQKEIKVLDPNITACSEKRDLMQQYIDTHAKIDFTQGLDIRLLDQYDIQDVNKMRIGTLHFAWDNPNDNLKPKFEDFAKSFRRRTNIGTVYILTNFGSTLDQDLYRIYTLRDLGYDPFVMIYNKPAAPKEVLRLQRWCNNKFVFKSTKSFNEYR